MSNILDPSHSELLSQLVDGELGSHHESSLFFELSKNESLRLEFRQLLLMKDSIKFDREAFDTPIDATVGLFSQLGFTSLFNTPDNTKTGILSSPAQNAQSNGIFSRKYMVPILVGLLATFMSFGVLSYYYEDKIADLKQSIAQMSSIEKQNPQSQDNQVNINENQGKNIPKASFEKPAKTYRRGNSDYHSVNNSGNNNYNNTNNNTNSNNIASNVLTTESDQKTNTEHLNNVIERSSSERNIPLDNKNNIRPRQEIVLYPGSGQNSFNDYPKSLNHSADIGYAIQLRGMTGTSFPNVKEPLLSNVLFDNMCIGAYYTMGENYMLGFEIGQEPIGQIFSNTKDGITSKVLQNPVIYWVGPSGRFMLNRISFLGGIQPYVQATVGFTELGPLLKGIVGLQYLSGSGLGAVLGLEGGYLQYRNQQTFYSSEKLGMTYGIFYKF